MRDPRVDPQPGDVVRFREWDYGVLLVEPDRVLVRARLIGVKEWWESRWLPLSTWWNRLATDSPEGSGKR